MKIECTVEELKEMLGLKKTSVAVTTDVKIDEKFIKKLYQLKDQ